MSRSRWQAVHPAALPGLRPRLSLNAHLELSEFRLCVESDQDAVVEGVGDRCPFPDLSPGGGVGDSGEGFGGQVSDAPIEDGCRDLAA